MNSKSNERFQSTPMTRDTALKVLGGFALVSLLVVYWGARDIVLTLNAMSSCQKEVQIDLSAFWFVGALSICGLSLPAFFRSLTAHKIILGLLVVWFVGAPIASHQYFLAHAGALGYDIAPAASLLRLENVTLPAITCTSVHSS